MSRLYGSGAWMADQMAKLENDHRVNCARIENALRVLRAGNVPAEEKVRAALVELERANLKK